MADERARALRRVLLALKPLPELETALQGAALLAAAERSDLIGLFVEEADQIAAAALPFTRVIGMQSGQAFSFQEREVERAFRLHAERMRASFTSVTRRYELHSRFVTTRGGGASALLEAARPHDLLVLQVSGREVSEDRAALARMLAEAPCDLLLLRPGSSLEGPVVAIYEGDSLVLRRAAALALAAHSRLSVWLLAEDSETAARLRRRARQWLSRAKSNALLQSCRPDEVQSLLQGVPRDATLVFPRSGALMAEPSRAREILSARQSLLLCC